MIDNTGGWVVDEVLVASLVVEVGTISVVEDGLFWTPSWTFSAEEQETTKEKRKIMQTVLYRIFSGYLMEMNEINFPHIDLWAAWGSNPAPTD